LDIEEHNPSPLVDAAFERDLKMIHTLLDAGADVSERDVYNSTALHYAVNFHLQEMIDLLLELGADVTVLDNDGAGAIFYGCRQWRRGSLRSIGSD